jgi:hypothetical protein
MEPLRFDSLHSWANVLELILSSSNLQAFAVVSSLVGILGWFLETLPGITEKSSPSSLPFTIVQHWEIDNYSKLNINKKRNMKPSKQKKQEAAAYTFSNIIWIGILDPINPFPHHIIWLSFRNSIRTWFFWA